MCIKFQLAQGVKKQWEEKLKLASCACGITARGRRDAIDTRAE